jgi:fructose transport system substrate-binding protein
MFWMKRILALGLLLTSALSFAQDAPIIGLITKTETNPFFVKMREGAQAKADELGVELMTAAGAFDGDNEAQVTAIENMVAAGAAGILLVPSDPQAIVPSVERAREQGVIVIALDTPLDPQDASDALFATDNYQAGVLIGQWAKAQMGDTAPVIAALDLNPGITVGYLRHNGFLSGYGLVDDAEARAATDDMKIPEIVCAQYTQGDQTNGQTAMENCLTANPEINLVYTINEPAAFGAYTAIRNAGLEDQVTVVSVDGGCAGVRGVESGEIDATSQQYPLVMASMGVEAIAAAVSGDEAPSGYTDTGVTLITDTAHDGVESEDSAYGLENCWGE